MSKTNAQKTSNVERTVRLALLGMFSAIIILLTRLPLKTMALEITLTMIPIAIGATVLGPSGGAVLGGVYGVCSYLQCFGLLYPSEFGATLLTINPFFTLITCLIPRILCGLLAGLTYMGMEKVQKFKLVSHSVTCLVCPLLNTLLFTSCILLFFGNSELIQGLMVNYPNPFIFVIFFVGINGLIEICSCFFLGTAISRVLTAQMAKTKK